MALCWRCREQFKRKDGVRIGGLIIYSHTHCHHDDPEEKPKDECWCEMTDLMFYYFAPNGGEIRQEAKFCPQCGKPLLRKEG